MKKLVLITIVLFTGITAIKGQEIIKFPNLATVVNEFDSKYQVNNDPYLQLAKTPEGWVTYELDYSAYPEIKKQNWQVLWSAQTKKFNTLNYKNEDVENLKTLKDIVYQSAFNYERYYFFGYLNAHKDAIEHLSGMQNLNDTLTEALGRAYSVYAMEFIDPGRYSTFETTEKEISDTIKLPEHLADSFVKYVSKAIDCFKKTYQLNPYYETLVGNMYIKYCNEHVYAYLTLCEIGYEEKAKKFLVPGLYGDAFLSIAKNFFNSIDNNGILFTNGDNDTYPLIYLQQTENYRKDAAVLNYSLLGGTRYIQLAQKGYNGIAPIKMTIRFQDYSRTQLSYVKVTESGNENSGAKSISQLINQLKNKLEIEDDFEGILTHNNSLLLQVNYKNCLKNKLIKNDDSNRVEIKINGGLYKNEVALLDIISTNDWFRPVFFTPGLKFIIDQNYLRFTGMTELLVPLKGKDEFEVDAERLDENLLKKFKFKLDESFNGKRGVGFRVNTHIMRFPYLIYSYHLLLKGDTIKAQIVANKGVDIIPNSYSPINDGMEGFGYVLYKTGDPKKGEEVLLHICEGLLEEYKAPVLEEYYLTFLSKKQRLDMGLDRVSETAVSCGYTKVLDRIDAIKKEVE